MARLSDLKLSYNLFMRAYRYRQIDWRPGARLSQPLNRARIAVVTTAGFYLPDQQPFDESIRGGDWSFRVIPAASDLSLLRHSHRSDAFDHTGIERDPNLALPLDRLGELALGGEIGEVAPRHFSLMGSVTAPGRLIAETIPAVVTELQGDRVDAVLLTPV